MKIFSIVLPLLFLNLCFFGTKSQAEPQTQQELPPVEVNARLWPERLIDVPGQVESVVMEENDDPLHQDLNLVTRKLTNVALEQSSVQTRLVIRGVGAVDTGLQDPVGYYINSVALPMGGNQLPPLFNVQSIEILKGPQGSLYGRNSEAGVVKIETQDPSWDFSAWSSLIGQTSKGNDNEGEGYRFSAGVSDALIDQRLAGNLALSIEDDRGPYYNQLDGNEDGGELKRWSLSSGLTAPIGKQGQLSFKSLINDSDTGRNRFRFNEGPTQTDRFETNTDVNGFDDSQTQVHGLKYQQKFEQLTLTSITGLAQYERQFEIDLDATPIPLPATLFDLDNQALSQELRLTNDSTGQTSRWLAGLYIYTESSDIDFSISPMFNTSIRETEIDQSGIALFGQWEYSLSEKLKLLLGARVESIRQEGEQNLSLASTTSSYSEDLDSTELLPKITLSYQPATDQLIYISFTEGYLPAGYNYNTAANEETLTFDQETSQLYEIGWRGQFFNQRLSAEWSAFQIVTEDKQIVDLEAGGIQRISNAAETEVIGSELGFDILFNQTLSAYLNLGWQDSEATRYTADQLQNGALTEIDLSGNQLPYAAEYSYTTGIKYQKTRGWLANLILRGSGDYFFDSQNQLEQSSYHLLDGELGYEFRHFKVKLWAKNITDEEVLSRAISTPAGVIVEDSHPQILGFQVSANWE